jgi:hypothetical protein
MRASSGKGKLMFGKGCGGVERVLGDLKFVDDFEQFGGAELVA